VVDYGGMDLVVSHFRTTWLLDQNSATSTLVDIFTSMKNSNTVKNYFYCNELRTVLRNLTANLSVRESANTRSTFFTAEAKYLRAWAMSH
jgi:hypothetical protein